jgi:hypothetical protein
MSGTVNDRSWLLAESESVTSRDFGRRWSFVGFCVCAVLLVLLVVLA